MKHARKDYDRFQDPAGLIPEDEPVMIFRGQDVNAPEALEAYANLHEQNGGDPEVSRVVREHAESMREWQATVKCKTADL